ncbi:hypothetical protein WJX84_010330 [Apatococcus fuscideae]|uniref:AB hydrolase-1 domain-containing protein n=1 Tax=Apatococcus fuscideae TaxID=2026836 RepID=A0AAW1T8X6_9CHLO
MVTSSTLATCHSRGRVEACRDQACIGHSFGGVPVSLATEALQEQTQALIYLDAHILQDNENFTAFLPESFMEGVRQEAAETGGWWFRKCIPADKWAAGYYNDVSYEEAKKAWDASHPEPINVWLDRVQLPASFAGTSRPSIFIEFLNDKCHGPEHWKLMTQRLPNCITRKAPGGHFAFATHPEEVAAALDDALQEALTRYD